jgi:hypothetical protein
VSPPIATLGIDEETDGAPLCFQSMADPLGAVPQQGVADTQLTEETLAAINDMPTTMEVALESKP